MMKEYDEKMLIAAIQREIDKVEGALRLLYETKLAGGYVSDIQPLIDYKVGERKGLEYAKFLIRE